MRAFYGLMPPAISCVNYNRKPEARHSSQLSLGLCRVAVQRIGYHQLMRLRPMSSNALMVTPNHRSRAGDRSGVGHILVESRLGANSGRIRA